MTREGASTWRVDTWGNSQEDGATRAKSLVVLAQEILSVARAEPHQQLARPYTGEGAATLIVPRGGTYEQKTEFEG